MNLHMIVRHLRAAMFVAVGTLYAGTCMRAQIVRDAHGGPGTRFWLGAGAGQASTDGGTLGMQWEDNKSEVYAGPKRHEQTVFGGVQMPAGRLLVIVAGGVGNALNCAREAEASACSEARFRDFRVPVVKASVDVELVPFTALYISTSRPLRQRVAFPMLVIGFEVGKVR
jgi:hypothetical protein